ncbi:PstS family phosphate ABC transporter substrate-binding protein [Edaphobacter bradus]|uniref:PstS family phosphate ABC transporter substrate-binding protein n=1 Tax=Edaphobacter bradus TaxID=2259016 RepID=UPI0021DFA709|nr:substrate-binding domain-containing protein [Edaphobacter bradus]
MTIKETILLGALLLPAPAHSQSPEDLAPYHPDQAVSGTITSWGHVFLKKVMLDWEAGFQKFHPDIHFNDNLVSSAAATGALFTHTADLGILGREIRPMEVAGYSRVMKQKPFPFEVMTGSFANADKSVALGIFVSKDNPLKSITFAQLDSVFGAEHRRGNRNIRTWGELGLTGDWASRPINLYSGVLDAAPGFFFSQVVMRGSLLWNENLKPLDDLDLPGGKVYEAQQRIVDALGQDRFGMALSGAGAYNPNVKLLSVSIEDTDPKILPTPTTVADRTYPLSRSVWIYINHKPGEPIDPMIREFLRYIFSREGQQAVARDGDYLPLTDKLAAEQLRKLHTQ